MAVNPLTVPSKVPFMSDKLVDARTGMTVPANDPAWLRLFQNMATILGNMTASNALGTVVLAFVAPSTSWLACNGAAVSRSTYSDLFALVGTTFGAGDGSTTFNLPTVASPTTGLTYYQKATL